MVEDHGKADGLELRQPHGAQAEGLCGVGSATDDGKGLEEGHSFAHMVAIMYICRSKRYTNERSHSYLSHRHQYVSS